jgi:predicted NAD/FAD-binding protein
VRIAVVGSGVSGLVCAHHLAPHHDVVLCEADARIGGHTHTRTLTGVDGRAAPVDTGFIVFNRRTYPSFLRLLGRLGVRARESDMSFSARSDARDLEYNGRDLRALYVQPKNLVSLRFHRMVLDVLRFYREARELLLADGPEVPLLEWLRARGYSDGFIEDHLLAMVGAVWSSSREGVHRFPARFLARFFENHGFLQVDDRPPWLTVEGGSSTYVKAILDGFRGEVRTAAPVTALRRAEDGPRLRVAGGAEERFDHVVLALHADQALRLLSDPSPVERELLSAFPYRPNQVLLHTDRAVMPRRPRAWASWNYHLDDAGQDGACVSYWMNNLQGLPRATDWFVTLNRAAGVRPEAVLERLDYAHPVFTPESVAAQARHAELIDHRATSYCGAYWRNGFHEDGVVSAERVCARLGVTP